MYVYILKSKVFSWIYVGMTDDLNKRVRLHNKGAVTSTKSKRPFKLVYYERIDNRKEARGKEKYYKTNAGKEFLRRRGLID